MLVLEFNIQLFPKGGEVARDSETLWRFFDKKLFLYIEFFGFLGGIMSMFIAGITVFYLLFKGGGNKLISETLRRIFDKKCFFALKITQLP